MNLIRLNRETLFAEFDLADLTEEEKDHVFALLLEIFNLRLLDHLLERLSFEDQQMFLATIQKDEEKARQFLTERIENLDVLISDVTKIVKRDFAQDLKIARTKR